MKLRHLLFAFLFPIVGYSQTVVDIIVNSEDHNTLETAVLAAGLEGTLSGDGPFTVFAPTDDAFAALPASTLDALLDDPMGALTDILLFHVANGTITSDLIEDGTTLQVLNRKGVDFTIDANGDIFVENAQITVTNLTATNGVVHVIDAVLVPNFSIMDVVEDSDVHNTLEAAIDAAGFTTILHSNDVALTLFAPTDAAFEALPDGTLETLLADPEGDLSDILLFHLVNGAVPSDALSDGMIINTVTGKQAMVTIDADDNIFIDGIQVVMANIATDNGIVHVIDAILTPPFTVLDVVRQSPDHTLLEALIGIAGLTNALNADADLTLFAPNDAAISALGQANIDFLLANPNVLQNILTYHVYADGSVESTEIGPRLVATTPTGLDILLEESGGNVTVNQGASVTAANLTTENGVVHVLNEVLLPNTTTSIVANSPAFTTLNAALEASGLDATLASIDNKLTVFAPTNAAFDALPDGVLDALLDDPMGALSQVLTYHAVGGRVFADQLSDGQVVMTVNGEDITVTIENGAVFINNAQVIQTDFFTGNGLIHVIDAVIEEPRNTVVDIIANSPDHNTLEAAVIAAGLTGTLSGDGPFTVFAPTDAAFDALPDGLVTTLLEDPTGDLTTILTYHVLGGDIRSTDLSDGLQTATLEGSNVEVTINAEGIFINDAQVIVEDLEADNGVVHVINGILLPGSYTNTEELPVGAVSVSPTLVSDYVSFTYADDVLDVASLYVFDGAGRLLMTQNNIFSGKNINLNTLDAGIYYVTLTDGEKATTKKITKI